jgi:hypothetical protein
MEDWDGPHRARAGAISTQLFSIAESLDDLIVDHLRTAMENGVSRRPPLDKDMQGARRAVEKAARMLSQ